MYIISKTKDYYDGVVGTMGIDKTLVYEREMVMNEDDSTFPEPFTAIKSWNRKRDNPFRSLRYGYSLKKPSNFDSSSPFIVGFCGKLYIGWKFYKQKRCGLYEDLETIITYDLDFIKKQLVHSLWRNDLLSDLEYIMKFNSMETFRNLNSPIFIYDSDYDRRYLGTYTSRSNEVFITNPILKNYEFYRVHDSFSAFQEIQMFIGGVLGRGEKEIKEVEDKYKIRQHGFDDKSFRRSKANGKKRPQSNR